MPKKSNSAAASAAAAAAIKSSKAPSAAGKAGAANGDAKFIDSIDPEDPEYQRQLMRPAEIKEDLTLMEQRNASVPLHPASPPPPPRCCQLTTFAAVMRQPTSLRERLLRCKLAAVYRLVDLHGWSRASIITYPSTSSSTPFGLEYREITAGSLLVKIDLAGDIVDRGCTVFGVNKAGWCCTRPFTRPGRTSGPFPGRGQQPLRPAAAVPEALAIMDEVAFHDFHGIVSDESERPALIESIGQKATVLLLRHHGVCVCGATLEEAWRRTELLMTAARIQLESLRAAGGPDNLWLPSEAAVAAGKAAAARSGANGWSFGQLSSRPPCASWSGAGYRTGYVYKEPRLRAPEDRPRKPQQAAHATAREEEAVAAPAEDEANAPETAQAAEPDPAESAKEEPVGESGTEQSQPAAEEAEKLNFDQSEQQPEV
uniref:Aldolase_II domain-containing protein n=1 Tax=Macrostomum lignano TaxID=282301 RepID=A0A1I8F3M6_9PLAT